MPPAPADRLPRHLPPSATLVLGRFALLGRPAVAWTVAIAAVLAIALADDLTGFEIRLAFLQLAPIALVTWSAGPMAGAALSTLAWALWTGTFYARHVYTNQFYFYWEGLVLIATFIVVVLLLDRLRRALALADERFLTLLGELDAPVYVERDGVRLLYANGRFRDAFGERTPLAPESGELYDEPTRRWYVVQSRRMVWMDGRAATLRVMADCTELKQAAENLRRHREALERSSRLVVMGELGSSLAHEMNQPLAAIATYIDTGRMMLDRGDVAGTLEVMARCRSQAARASAIVHRLRDFLRQRKSAPHPQPLVEIARRAVDSLQPEAADGGVALGLEIAIDETRAQVIADAMLLEQVLLNLLRNALESLAGLTGPRRIDVRVVSDAARGVVVRVEDTGAGVTSDVEALMFDPFFSTKADGLGLGLCICRSIVGGHGGQLWHEPRPGGGAVFAFSLPLSERG